MSAILIHFGDHCGSGILIDDIVGRSTPGLFKLLAFVFNGIYQYLKDGDLHAIYRKEFILTEQRQAITNFQSIVNGYNHNTTAYHSKYPIGFVHDFLIDGTIIRNYDFVCRSYQAKIAQFEADLQASSLKVFVVVSATPADLKLAEMIALLEERVMDGNFLILLYTNSDYQSEPRSKLSQPAERASELSSKLRIVRLQRSYDKWWEMTPATKTELYREFYDRFREIMAEFGQSYPPFEATRYFSR